MQVKPSAPAGKRQKGFWVFFLSPQIKARPRLHSPTLLCFPVSGAGSLPPRLSVGCCCTLSEAGLPQGASRGQFQHPSPTLSLWSRLGARTPHPQPHPRFFPPSLRPSSPNTSSFFGESGKERAQVGEAGLASLLAAFLRVPFGAGGLCHSLIPLLPLSMISCCWSPRECCCEGADPNPALPRSTGAALPARESQTVTGGCFRDLLQDY